MSQDTCARCPETSQCAKGIRTPDLLDANETIWAFVTPSCVGCARKSLVTALGLMVTGTRKKFCWVPTAYRQSPGKPGYKMMCRLDVLRSWSTPATSSQLTRPTRNR